MKYSEELNLARKSYPKNKALLKKFRQQKPKVLDDRFRVQHEAVFQEIDCLECANCCKTTSPLFIMADIERLAKHLKVKPQVFIETYLTIDEDDDYVLQSTPCPFLGEDNKCFVYEHRPKACREYPHTNRKRIYQIMDLTLKNTLICPAAARIVGHIANNVQ
jgi:uncharacterized protein